MPRGKRIWYPGAMYHITARGNRKENIFLSDYDRMKYLATIQKVKTKFRFNLHAYCLMSNHIHLLIETTQFPPGKILHLLHLNYSKYFNKKYDHVGHLFQGRYWDKLIMNRYYFTKACSYIHLNPSTANLLDEENSPLWSSHYYYANNESDPLITKELLLAYIDALSYDEWYKLQQFENKK
ncbi:transposase [Halobacillus sp. Marseille-Q1614]|uniref:transposase n=1 Tax=Halobacillus sp. Marseille-Q1614 TaxID=2709134 RepID=UPI0015713473|nr:transposase [Halobacillus sp. Marseille-Q1614]